VEFVVCIMTLAASCGLSAWSNETPRKTVQGWNAPTEADRKANPVRAEASSIALGKTVYLSKCVACHGRAGKGDGPTAPRLKVHPGDLSNPNMAQQTDGELFWKITEGKTPMPSYRSGLSEKERWTVVNYIRTLAPNQGSPLSTPATSPQSRVSPESPR
jgi:mono/diheme cytochrome c family protein